MLQGFVHSLACRICKKNPPNNDYELWKALHGPTKAVMQEPFVQFPTFCFSLRVADEVQMMLLQGNGTTTPCHPFQSVLHGYVLGSLSRISSMHITALCGSCCSAGGKNRWQRKIWRSQGWIALQYLLRMPRDKARLVHADKVTWLKDVPAAS